MLQTRECCRTLCCKRMCAFVGAADGSLEKVPYIYASSRAWKASLLQAERNHAGGKRRTYARYGRPRCWRRQVAQYIVAETASDF